MPKPSNQTAALPDYALFQSVCRGGLSRVRPLRNGTSAKDDAWGWNYGSGWLYGRMQAMMTLLEAAAVAPTRVLEVAAGDAALSACLASMGCAVTANDLRAEALAAAVGSFSNAESIRCLPGNLFDLDPAATGQFDLVIACERLCQKLPISFKRKACFNLSLILTISGQGA